MRPRETPKVFYAYTKNFRQKLYVAFLKYMQKHKISDMSSLILPKDCGSNLLLQSLQLV